MYSPKFTLEIIVHSSCDYFSSHSSKNKTVLKFLYKSLQLFCQILHAISSDICQRIPTRVFSSISPRTSAEVSSNIPARCVQMLSMVLFEFLHVI